jgi:hypothetical protein
MPNSDSSIAKVLTDIKLDSAFQLQEHLKALHHHYIKPSDSDSSVPINRETAILIATQPDGVDRALWLYELCRFLINKCNELIIGFLFDDPPCSATTCPEMRASEWQFLCAVHESPKSCCAIDYCCHTLDWATNIVTSQKIFPSRLSLGAGDAMDDRGAGVKHLTNIFRRLHRIFAHAWFQHRGVFWQVEGQTGLYVLFKTVCDTYELLPAENYKLPPEAEGLEPVEEVKAPVPAILKAEGNHKFGSFDDDFVNAARSGTSTRRHIRQSPSVGSAVPTVLESDEEDPDVTAKFKDLEITEEEDEEDAGNTTEVPVIVESYEVDERNDGSPRKAESPILEHTESEAPDDPSISLTPDSSEDEPEEEEKEEVKETDDEDAAESMSPIVPDAEITITAPSPTEAEAKNTIEEELKKEESKDLEDQAGKADDVEKTKESEEDKKEAAAS